MVDKEVLATVQGEIDRLQLKVVDQNLEKPWGGYFCFAEAELPEFAAAYFPNLDVPPSENREKMSPKILMAEPGARLSWQHHARRAEDWRVIEGPVGVVLSETDEETELITLREGEEIHIPQGHRHRLIGLDQWGVVAEIWRHTHATQPSDESDIVRVQDDYDRPRTEG